MTHDNTQSDVVEALREVERVLVQGSPAITCTVFTTTGTGETLLDHVQSALASLSTKDSDAVLEERWQPIETAPKGDGKFGPDILLWQASVYGEQKIGMFHWLVDEFVANGWENDPALNPTHWMPLPGGPAAIRKGDNA